MKRASIIILISLVTFCFFKAEKSNSLEFTEKTDPRPPILPKWALRPEEKQDLKKISAHLTEIETQLLRFKNYSYEDFSQQDLKIYNELILERALILKKQIFSKAAKMGYYL